MRNIIRTIRGAALAAALLIAGASTARAQGFQVIVNSANDVSSLSKGEISNMLLKKTPKWPSGAAVQAVDNAKGSAVRDAFSKAIHGRPASAVAAYWQEQIFSGADTPPAEKDSDAAVVAFVKANAGAIGYVSAAADVSGVKVITVK